jgi:hypothetical protein
MDLLGVPLTWYFRNAALAHRVGGRVLFVVILDVFVAAGQRGLGHNNVHPASYQIESQVDPRPTPTGSESTTILVKNVNFLKTKLRRCTRHYGRIDGTVRFGKRISTFFRSYYALADNPLAHRIQNQLRYAMEVQLLQNMRPMRLHRI